MLLSPLTHENGKSRKFYVSAGPKPAKIFGIEINLHKRIALVSAVDIRTTKSVFWVSIINGK